MRGLDLNELQSEAMKELFNISLGTAADVLSQMAGQEIHLNVPEIHSVRRKEIYSIVQEHADDTVVAVHMCTHGFFSGESVLIFTERYSLSLVKAILSDQVPLEMLPELEEEALLEVGNVVLSSCLSTFANLLEQRLETAIPVCVRGTVNEVMKEGTANDEVIFISVDFTHEKGGERGYISMTFDINSGEHIVEAVDDYLRRSGLL